MPMQRSSCHCATKNRTPSDRSIASALRSWCQGGEDSKRMDRVRDSNRFWETSKLKRSSNPITPWSTFYWSTFYSKRSCDFDFFDSLTLQVWEILPENHRAGTVTHTVGWPLDLMSYGGGVKVWSDRVGPSTSHEWPVMTQHDSCIMTYLLIFDIFVTLIQVTAFRS